MQLIAFTQKSYAIKYDSYTICLKASQLVEPWSSSLKIRELYIFMISGDSEIYGKRVRGLLQIRRPTQPCILKETVVSADTLMKTIQYRTLLSFLSANKFRLDRDLGISYRLALERVTEELGEKGFTIYSSGNLRRPWDDILDSRSNFDIRPTILKRRRELLRAIYVLSKHSNPQEIYESKFTDDKAAPLCYLIRPCKGPVPDINDFRHTVADVQTLLKQRLEFINKCIAYSQEHIGQSGFSEGILFRSAKSWAREKNELRKALGYEVFDNLLNMVKSIKFEHLFDSDAQRLEFEPPSHQFILNVIEGLNGIPKPTLNKLREKGFEISVEKFQSDRGIDPMRAVENQNPEIAGVYDDSLYTTVAYFAYPTVHLPEYYKDNGTFRLTDKIIAIIKHEAAHGVDKLLIDGQVISNWLEFREAYKKDFENLTDDQRRDLAYVIQLDNFGQPTAYNEAFAEILADMWGGGYMEGDVTKGFPQTSEWVREYMTKNKLV